MLHVFLLILVYATPVDGGHRAGANGSISFYRTSEECAASAQINGDRIAGGAAIMPGEEVLGATAMCIEAFVPTESSQATAIRHAFEKAALATAIHKSIVKVQRK